MFMCYCKSFLLCALKNVFRFFSLPIAPKYLEIIDFRWLNIASPTCLFSVSSQITFFNFKEMKKLTFWSNLSLAKTIISLGFIFFPLCRPHWKVSTWKLTHCFLSEMFISRQKVRRQVNLLWEYFSITTVKVGMEQLVKTWPPDSGS